MARRDVAAVATLERIARDRESGSPGVAPVLAYIERHLFDPDLRYETLRRELGIRDNNRSTLFRRDTGLAPAAYVRECRFEVACRLLRDSDLVGAKVGELVGYRTPSTFVAAFRRWSGLTPAQYRTVERASLATTAAAPSALPDLSPAAWRRFVEGELGEGDAERLLSYLLDRYPSCRRHLLGQLLAFVDGSSPGEGDADDDAKPRRSLRSLFARRDVERLMAEVVVEEIEGRPWKEQLAAAGNPERFVTRAVSDLLAERSLYAPEPNRALALARLALEAARSLRDEDERGLSASQSLAWAALARAQLRLGDFLAAEAAFSAIDHRLPPAEVAPRAAAFSRLARSLSAHVRRDADGAARLAADALRLLDLDRGSIEARAVAALQSAAIHRHRGSAVIATEEAERGRQLASVSGVADLELWALAELVACRLAAGDVVQARLDLSATNGHTRGIGSRRLEWLGALADLAAGDGAEGLDRLAALDAASSSAEIWSALVALDLALVLQHRDEPTAADDALVRSADRLASWARSLPLGEAAEEVARLVEQLRSRVGRRGAQRATTEARSRLLLFAELHGELLPAVGARRVATAAEEALRGGQRIANQP